MSWRDRIRRGLPLADGCVPIGGMTASAWSEAAASTPLDEGPLTPAQPEPLPLEAFAAEPMDVPSQAESAHREAQAHAERAAGAEQALRDAAFRQGYESGRHDSDEALAPLVQALKSAAEQAQGARAGLGEALKQALSERLVLAARALADGSRLEAVERAARELAERASRSGQTEPLTLECEPALAQALAERLGDDAPFKVEPKAGLGMAVRLRLAEGAFEALPQDLARVALAAARGDAKEDAFRAVGTVVRTRGPLLEAEGLRMNLGDLAEVGSGPEPLLAEAVGFDGGKALLSPLGDLRGLGPGERVASSGRQIEVPSGRALLGHVLDAMGRPMDGRALPEGLPRVKVHPLSRQRDPLAMGRVLTPFATGVSALDGFLTCGVGQRLGIFAGSGVGKSTLLGMLARRCEADAVVIGLIGERGREVRDFLERDLGEEGRARSVVIAATSDQPPALRVQAALTATSVAEAFRAEGMKVLLLMDSVTRFAQSLREIGLSLGEPPATRGYPPSVFAALPRLLERSGALEGGGSITAFYTVLVEGDDMNEPVSDTVRGILDGHVVLNRGIAESGRYPAVDVLGSLSRCMPEVVTPEHLALAQRGRRLFSALEGIKDLLSVGAYREGADPVADEARKLVPVLEDMIRQVPADVRTFDGTLSNLRLLLNQPAS